MARAPRRHPSRADSLPAGTEIVLRGVVVGLDREGWPRVMIRGADGLDRNLTLPPSFSVTEFDRRVFLHIDHINNDGNAHRREMGVRNSYRVCSWIVKNPDPSDAIALYQILCANCNMAKAIEENHTCP